ncbi:MAG TPA: hypothetical protein PKB09_04625 [Candidatus Saccharibacteria bacterium]|nr:hypothetical protein [Candidatus Saccharibacteria bacterium]
MATKKSSANNRGNLVFNSVFAVQRIALLSSVGAAVLYWAHLVSVATNFALLSGQGNELKNPDEANIMVDSLLNNSIRLTVTFSVIALVLTLALPRLRQKNNSTTKTVISGLVIALFCIFVTVFGQVLYRSFLANVSM